MAEIHYEKITMITMSVFFVLALFLTIIGQTDKVRNDPNTIFGTNISAGVFAALASIMALAYVLFHEEK